MTLTDEERRQLGQIGEALADDAPALACKLNRMSGYSLESARMAISAVCALLVGSIVLFAVGFGLGHPLCVVAGAVAVALSLTVALGWRTWVRRVHRPVRPEGRRFAPRRRLAGRR